MDWIYLLSCEWKGQCNLGKQQTKAIPASSPSSLFKFVCMDNHRMRPNPQNISDILKIKTPDPLVHQYSTLMIPSDYQQKQQKSDLQFVCLDPKYTNHLVLVFAICGWSIPTQWIYYGPLASLYWRLDQGNIFLIGAENADIFQSGRARMALWDLQKPPSGNCLDSSYRQLLTK